VSKKHQKWEKKRRKTEGNGAKQHNLGSSIEERTLINVDGEAEDRKKKMGPCAYGQGFQLEQNLPIYAKGGANRQKSEGGTDWRLR